MSDEDLVKQLRHDCDVMGDWICGDAAAAIHALKTQKVHLNRGAAEEEKG